MLEVEWYDHRLGKDRRGQLLQVSPTNREPANVAYVITTADTNEVEDRSAIQEGDSVIVSVALEKLKVTNALSGGSIAPLPDALKAQISSALKARI